MLLFRDFDQFAKRLEIAESTNPPPPELLEIYKEVEQWAVKDYIASNLKMAKPAGGRQKWIAAGIAFLPANDAKRVVTRDPAAWHLTAGEAEKLTNVCRGATAGCLAVCLTNAGQMRMDDAKAAQLRRQLAFTFKRNAFMVLTMIGIAALSRYARNKGAKPCVRLNVTSDIDWENIEVTVSPWMSEYLKTMGTYCAPGNYQSIPDAFPSIQFYDYTKRQERMQAFAGGRWPRNYWLTWSLAETPANRKVALWVLENKASTVAVPFDVKSRKQGARIVGGKKVGGKILPLPGEMVFVENGPEIEQSIRHTFPVIDANHDDMRFLDKPGSFSGLRFKVPGIAKGQRRGAIAGGMSTQEKIDAASGFVVPVPPDGIPEIAVYRSWQGAKANPRQAFRSDLELKRRARVTNRLAKRRAARQVDREAKTDRITRRSNPSADEKLAWIRSQLESGRDVYLTTATRSTRFMPKYLDRLADLLRVKGGSLQMRERKSWVSADYVKISAR